MDAQAAQALNHHVNHAAHAVVVFAGSRLQKLFHNARAIKLQNRVFGGLLMAVGAGLFFVKRSHAAAH